MGTAWTVQACRSNLTCEIFSQVLVEEDYISLGAPVAQLDSAFDFGSKG